MIGAARNGQPAFLFGIGCLDFETVKLDLLGQDEGQCSGAGLIIVRLEKQRNHWRADKFCRRPAQSFSYGFGDIGEVPRGVGGPEPAQPAFLKILQQGESICRFHRTRFRGWLRADPGTDVSEKTASAGLLRLAGEVFIIHGCIDAHVIIFLV